MMKHYVRTLFLLIIFLPTIVFGQRWSTKASLPVRVKNNTVSVVNGKLYSIGGFTNSYQFTKDVYEYDPATNAWISKSSLPNLYTTVRSAVINNNIYVIGESAGALYVAEFNPATNFWTVKTATTVSRSDYCVSAANGKIYVIGGWTTDAVNTVEEYDLSTNTWNTKASMPTARSGASAVTYNNQIYVIGGLNNNGVQNTVEVYNPVANTWSTKSSMPTARRRLETQIVAGKIYAIGGFSSGNENKVEVFDITANTWSSVPDTMLTRRESFGLGVIYDIIYCVGGNNTAILNVNEAYNPLKPATPTGLFATGSDHRATLIWNQNPESNISYYVIYRNLTSGFSPSPSDSIGKSLYPSTTFIDSTVQNGRTYYYRISAVTTLSKMSDFSTQAGVIPVDFIPPAAPQNIIAQNGGHYVHLEWSANTEPDLKGYKIFRNLTNGFTPTPADSIAYLSRVLGTVSFNDSAIINGVTYYYRIVAIDSSHNISGFSAQASATPLDTTPPSAPQNIIAVASHKRITLSWTKSPETDVLRSIIYRSQTAGFSPTRADSIGFVAAVGSVYADTNVTIGRRYYYRISALDYVFNESAFSVQVSAVPIDTIPPSVPQNVIVTNGDRKLTINWNANSETDLGKYIIYRSRTSGFTPTPADSIAFVTHPTTMYRDSALSVGVTYYYKIAAVDTSLNRSGYSIQAFGVPYDSTAPSIPQNIIAVSGQARINLSWSANPESDVLKYTIYRSTTAGFTPTPSDSIARVLRPGIIYTDSVVSVGIPYYYRIAAVDSFSNRSGFSSQATAVPFDTIPPAAPATIIATVDDRRVSLRWNKNTEPDMLKYIIYRSLINGFTPTHSDSIGVKTHPDTTFIDTDVYNKLTYYYRFAAVDSFNNRSAFSVQLSAVPTDTIPPSVPQNIIITNGERKLILNWNANSETDLGKYIIYRSRTSGFTPTQADSIAFVTHPMTTYHDSALSVGVTFYYRIAAVDTSYNRSGYSIQAFGVPYDSTAPSVPQNIIAVSGQARINLSWSANPESDVLKYTIYRSTTAGFTPAPSDSIARVLKPDVTYTDFAVAPTIRYYYRIAAVDSFLNKSGFSVEVNAVPIDTVPPAAPINIIATPGNRQVSLKWKENTEPDMLKYVIYRSLINGFTPTPADSIGIKTQPDTTFIDTNLYNGQTYYYRIAAVDSFSNRSAYSAQASATPAPLISNSWITHASMPTARRAPISGTINGKIYTVGGNTGAARTPVVEEYNPVTNTWAVKASLPSDREDFGGDVYNGQLYIIGGSQGGTRLATVERYNASNNSWTTIRSMSNIRRDLVVVASSTDLFAIGGRTANTTYRNFNEQFTLPDSTWTTRTAMPTSRWGMAGAEVDGLIYVIGGSNATTYLNTVEVYDPVANSWSTRTNIPTARRNMTADVIGGKIYIIGGEGSAGTLDIVEIYDPATDTWITGEPMLAARTEISSAVIGGSIYVIGGINGSVSAVNEEYNPKPWQPQNLSASIQATKITLQWNANKDPDIAHYIVYRSLINGFTPSVNTIIGIADNPDTTFIDRNIQPGTTYYYRITAVDEVGQESRQYSTQISATTQNYTLALGIEDTLLTNSDTLTVPLSFLGNFDIVNVTSFQFAATYDSTILTALTVDTIGFGHPITLITNIIPGKVSVAGYSTEPLRGASKTMHLKFIVNMNAGRDTTTIQLQDVLFNEGNPAVNITSTQVRISPRYGDVSGNKIITSYDAALVLQNVVGIIQFSQSLQEKADVTYNGSVTALDAYYILLRATNVITRFPVEDSLGLKIAVPPQLNFPVTVNNSITSEHNSIALHIGGTGEIRIESMYLEIEFNNTLCSFNSVQFNDLFGNYIHGEHAENGVVRVALAGTPSAKLDKDIVTVTFTPNVVVNAGDISRFVKIRRIEINDRAVSISSVEEITDGVPRIFNLKQNYPNPFNPETMIQYELPKPSRVVLKIYNILGQEVKTLINTEQPAGSYSVKWNGRNESGYSVAPGIYFYHLKAGEFEKTLKMLLIK